MDRIIGRLFYIFIFINCSIFSSTNLILNISDLNNQDIKQVGIGIPFLIKLSIDCGENTNISKVEIENLNNLHVQERGSNISIKTINGKMKYKKNHIYEARIDKEGKYKIGPAKVIINGNEFKSNELIVDVGDEKKVLNQDNNSLLKKRFLKLSVDKNNVFINEKINLKIRLYYQDEDNIVGIEKPEFKNFHFGQINGPVSNTEKIDNEDLLYQELNIPIYPKTTGELIIPSIKAAVEYPLKKSNNNLFTSFFGYQYERKDLRSNSLKINVKPLPKYNEKVNAVGNFKDFKAKINQDSAFQGDGIVLTLELEGEGNFESIEIDKLNLPTELRYYDSKKFIEPLENENQKKVFEFIVQALKSGKFVIPSQTFVYFDPKNQEFKYLKTEPINLNIKELQSSKNKQIKDKVVINEKINDDSDIKPIIKDFKSNKQRKIPFNWFLILLLIPLFIKIVSKEKIQKKFKKDKAIFVAQNQIQQLKKNKNYSDIYTIFIDFFCNEFKVNKPIITEEFMIKKMKDFDLDENTINQWQEFITKITAVSFYNQKLEFTDQENLIAESIKWLDLIKKKL